MWGNYHRVIIQFKMKGLEFFGSESLNLSYFLYFGEIMGLNSNFMYYKSFLLYWYNLLYSYYNTYLIHGNLWKIMIIMEFKDNTYSSLFKHVWIAPIYSVRCILKIPDW